MQSMIFWWYSNFMYLWVLIYVYFNCFFANWNHGRNEIDLIHSWCRTRAILLCHQTLHNCHFLPEDSKMKRRLVFHQSTSNSLDLIGLLQLPSNIVHLLTRNLSFLLDWLLGFRKLPLNSLFPFLNFKSWITLSYDKIA